MKKGLEKKGLGKRESRRDHNPVEARSEETAKLASMLAPLEEQQGREAASGATQRSNGGAIIVDTGPLKLPKDFIEQDEGWKPFGLEPVVIVILALVLAFIAFITYLISIEPPR